VTVEEGEEEDEGAEWEDAQELAKRDDMVGEEEAEACEGG